MESECQLCRGNVIRKWISILNWLNVIKTVKEIDMRCKRRNTLLGTKGFE